MKRASLHTIGCRLNQAETAVLASRLRQDGYHIVEFGEPTDLLVVNSCSVTTDAERTCRYVIRKTLKHSPEAFVAVTGCYAQTGIQNLRSLTGVDLIVGNQFKWDLPALLPPPVELRKRPAPEVMHTKTIGRDEFNLPWYGDPGHARAPLKIQDGCNVMCSFCIIPFARGHERSRSFADVLAEAGLLAAGGYREIVLTGVNIGAYRSGEHDLVDLLDRLEQIEGLDRIRLSSIEPTTITTPLIERMSTSSKLCPYLHVPLQSGDDDVLALMNRPYRLAEYVALIEQALTAVPDLGLGTDVMIGFPGESDQAFRRTVQTVEALPFSYLHVFPYSERPGTAAAKLRDKVPSSVANERTRAATELSRVKKLAFAERWIGSTVPVLFESGMTDGLRLGTTPHFLKVGVVSVSDLAHQVENVLITGVTDRCAVGHLGESRSTNRLVPVI